MPATTHVSPPRVAPGGAALFCLAAGLLAAAPALRAQTFRYLDTFGTSGSGTLDHPSELAFDPMTRDIYVTDTYHDRVVVFDAAGGYLGEFGGSGSADGQFDWPAGIAIDPVSHDVIVADYYGNRVQSFDTNGMFLSTFGASSNGNPCGVAVRAGDRDIIVSDGWGASVRAFDLDLAYLGTFDAAADFGYACDLAIGPMGSVLVADETHNVVVRFDAGGVYLGQFGGYGSADGQMNSPAGVGVDPVSGNIVVVDAGNNRIETFDPAGNFLGKFGSGGSGPGQFSIPIGIAFDPLTHDLLVADRSNDRIQRFANCGPTHLTLSILPQTQAQNQATFFSASIPDVVSPSGTVALYAEDGALICTAQTGGDPQASCSGYLGLGIHAVTAQYSGNGTIPSGCSETGVATVVDDTMLTATNAALLITPPSGWQQGKPITLTHTVSAPPAPGNAASAQTATFEGYVTFYDGTNVIAEVPLAGNQAEFTNAFVGGSHQFSSAYSGDGTHQTSSDGQSVDVTAPADGLFYDSFEVPPGN